mgnify:CR=1 FL=1
MRVKIKTREKSWRDSKETFLELLNDCAPNILRGTLNPIGLLKDGKRTAYSLVYRDGKNIKTTYIPAKELKEARRMADNYKEARRLLNCIANCNLGLLKHRIEARKLAEDTAKSTGRSRK